MTDHLSDRQYLFLQDCAGEGPTDPTPAVAEELERRGFVSYVFEGRGLQGKWRLTSRGRRAMEAERKRTR